MKKSPPLFLVRISAAVLLAGVCATSAFSQGRGGSGGFNTGSGGFNTGSGGGFNTGSTSGTGGNGSSGSSSSLFNSGGGGSNSLFNSGGSSSSSGNSSSGSSGSGSGSGQSNLGTEIQTGDFGAATPITRGAAIQRNTSGSYLINSNPDIVGGQPSGNNNNQFANLFSQIGRQMNQGGNFNQQGGRNTVRPAIRIPLVLGFAPKPVSIPQFTAKFESRMAKLPGISAIGPIRVTMEGSTAVLTGVVASDQDRQLAEGVALLEPEVATVRNELTVQGVEAAEGP